MALPAPTRHNLWGHNTAWSPRSATNPLHAAAERGGKQDHGLLSHRAGCKRCLRALDRVLHYFFFLKKSQSQRDKSNLEEQSVFALARGRRFTSWQSRKRAGMCAGCGFLAGNGAANGTWDPTASIQPPYSEGRFSTPLPWC